MSTDSPHDSVFVPLTFAVVTVSTSRSAAGAADVDDRSGAVIAEACTAAGHSVLARSLVPDDPAAIARALVAALDSTAQVVVFTGGTGISARDCTPRVLREHLDREIPGFGELFRMLSWQQVGSRAMLSSAIAGVAAGKPVFALPGSPRACSLAMEKLVLPEVGHIRTELAKETPLAPMGNARPAVPVLRAAPPARPVASHPTLAPASRGKAVDAGGDLPPPEAVAVPTGVSLTVQPDAERMDAPPIASGWEAGLRSLHGTVERAQPEIPDALLRMQPVVDVLNSAGTRAVVRLADGREYGAWGFPDLARRGSKVLLVREAEPIAEVIALHRWPGLAGLCAEEGGVLPDATLALPSFTEDRTGRAYEGPGQLFAVDGTAVWISHQKKVFKWDGTRSEAQAQASAEPLSSALATLVLSWAGR